jgi:hypothetical protein
MAVAAMDSEEVIVTGSRMARQSLAMVANEEGLGDLKLYRVPEPVTVAAKGQKQVAFLDKEGVNGRFVYVQDCDPYAASGDALRPAHILFATDNSEARGLGAALPNGGLTLYEPTSSGDQLVAETRLRDFAAGEEIELALVPSAQVFVGCGAAAGSTVDEQGMRWTTLVAEASNANPAAATVRFRFGDSGGWQLRGVRGARVKDGQWIVEQRIPANARKRFSWKIRRTPD